MLKAVLRLEVERIRKNPQDLIDRVHYVWKYFNFIKKNIPGQNIDYQKFEARESYYSSKMTENIYYCDGEYEKVLKGMFGEFIKVDKFGNEAKNRILAEVQHNTNFILEWLAIDSTNGEILHSLASSNQPALVRMGVALNQCTEPETRDKLKNDRNKRVREINRKVMMIQGLY